MQINFGRQLKQVAQQFSDKLALVNIERDRRFTFKQLHLLTNKICNMMRDNFGLKQGDSYGLLLENDNHSLFNLWVCKGFPTGLWFNYRDSFDEHMYQIDYVKPKVLFVEKEVIDREGYYEAFIERNIHIVTMDRVDRNRQNVYYFWDLVEGASDAEVEAAYDIDEHITLFRFTGGTTGRGKCVMYSLRNYIAGMNQNFAFYENLIDNNTKHLHFTPLSHASAARILPVYFKGGTQYTINVPDLHYFCEVIEKFKITSTSTIPTLLYRLIDLELNESYDLSSLKTISYGASPMSPAKLIDLQNKFGNIFVQGYGSTEAWPPILQLGKSDHLIENEADKKRLSSAGKALPGVEVKIVNDGEIEVSIGETGEIWIRGASVTKGYYKAPEETKKGYSDDGFWKSGDMGYMDEHGCIYIVDRKKDMIITGGFNVYAIEVENALNSHPAVQQSVVVGIPDEQWGEAVHAEVILKDNEGIEEEELVNFTRGILGKYKVPKSINFVTEFPMTSVGKVLRRNVKANYWQDKGRSVN